MALYSTTFISMTIFNVFAYFFAQVLVHQTKTFDEKLSGLTNMVSKNLSGSKNLVHRSMWIY